jgi:hypothetical protein
MRVVMGSLRHLILTVLVLSSSVLVHAQQGAQRNPSGALQAFMLTTTYGVIAGTLTGVASLAFYESPGNKGRNIAIGASLGLYVGILLGAYIVYVPALGTAPGSRDQEDELDEDPIRLDSGSLDLRPRNGGAEGSLYGHNRAPQTSLTPLMSWDPELGTQVGLVYKF